MSDDYVKMLQEGTGQPVSTLKIEVPSERRILLMDLERELSSILSMPAGTISPDYVVAKVRHAVRLMQSAQIDMERQDERLRRLEEMVLCR